MPDSPSRAVGHQGEGRNRDQTAQRLRHRGQKLEMPGEWYRHCPGVIATDKKQTTVLRCNC
jgi:hypothetical protein